MDVCSNCFADKEIKGLILSSQTTGECHICNSKNVHLLDSTELQDFFQELIDNFKPSNDGRLLKSIIQADWHFFSSYDVATRILNEMLSVISTDISSSTDLVNYTDEIHENINYWEELKEELKWSRRFLFNIEKLEELGWDGFFNDQYELKLTDKLYRARVHHQSGLPAYDFNKMKCPAPKLAGGGRANPIGIPYLYLCNNPDTVIYEVRTSYLDEVSIATFQLKHEHIAVKIVDFTDYSSLFRPTMVNNTIKSKLLREKISRDLSKPMRRYDTEVEYIPTQFICEYIKVITGANGIRFNSSLHPEGKNIVIFDQELVECKEVVLKKVDSLKMTTIDI